MTKHFNYKTKLLPPKVEYESMRVDNMTVTEYEYENVPFAMRSKLLFVYVFRSFPISLFIYFLGLSHKHAYAHTGAALQSPSYQ